MAEADMEDPSQLKFYCHRCKMPFATVFPNFTCSRCSLGFIEEVEVMPEPKQEAPEPENYMLRYGDFHNHSLQPDAFEMRGSNDRNESSDPESHQRITRVAEARHDASYGNLMQEIISDHAVALGLVRRASNVDDRFLRNIGTIVIELSNLVFNTGAPPVSKEVVDTLEIVEVTPEHVSTESECSICWEIYVLGEPVRQLPCGHKYHDTCIRQWLLIHATCPICRKHITENETTTDGLSTSNAGSAIEALDGIVYEGNRSNSPSSSTASRGSDSITSSDLDDFLGDEDLDAILAELDSSNDISSSDEEILECNF